MTLATRHADSAHRQPEDSDAMHLIVRSVKPGLTDGRLLLRPGQSLVVDAAPGHLYRIQDAMQAVVPAQDARREGSDLVIVLSQGIEVRIRQFFVRKPTKAHAAEDGFLDTSDPIEMAPANDRAWAGSEAQDPDRSPAQWVFDEQTILDGGMMLSTRWSEDTAWTVQDLGQMAWASDAVEADRHGGGGGDAIEQTVQHHAPAPSGSSGFSPFGAGMLFLLLTSGGAGDGSQAAPPSHVLNLSLVLGHVLAGNSLQVLVYKVVDGQAQRTAALTFDAVMPNAHGQVHLDLGDTTGLVKVVIRDAGPSNDYLDGFSGAPVDALDDANLASAYVDVSEHHTSVNINHVTSLVSQRLEASGEVTSARLNLLNNMMGDAMSALLAQSGLSPNASELLPPLPNSNSANGYGVINALLAGEALHGDASLPIATQLLAGRTPAHQDFAAVAWAFIDSPVGRTNPTARDIAAQLAGGWQAIDHSAPTFDSEDSVRINVIGNAAQLVHTVRAVDHQQVTYTLLTGQADDAGLFAIHPSTGALTLQPGPTFTAKTRYQLTVVAADPSGNSSAQQLTLNDSNDPPSAVVLSQVHTSLSENSPIPEPLLVANLRIADDALGRNTLGLSGVDATAFDLIDGALYLKAGTLLDYEQQAQYRVTVEATDLALVGSSAVTAHLALSVNDVNEAPSALHLENAISTLADNTLTDKRVKVADIRITDDALGSNQIRLSDADVGVFELDQGVLYLRAGTILNAGGQARYEITLQVEDSSLPGSLPVGTRHVLNIIDRTPPMAPTLVLTDVGKDSHDGLTSINVVTVGQLERGAQWAYRIGSGNWTSGTGSQFSLPEGSHVLGNVRVRQTDDAGNTSAEGANSAPFNIDLTAPTAPQAMLAFYKPDGIARVSSQGTVNVAGLEPTATWAYMLIHLAN